MSILVDQLTKTYGAQKAIDAISFKMGRGEIVGLLGPNGAGKTTTMKILSGFIGDFTGQAQVAGLDVSQQPVELKQLIGYLPEHNPLYLEMYVREYLSFIARVHKLDHATQKVDDAIARVGLSLEQHKLIKTLSKGYRQRVGLAQALIHDPQVLILDEPTSGLDPNQLVEIRQLIKNIGQEKTVVFSSHIMQEVQAICDRVIILNRGKIVADEKVAYLDQMGKGEVEIYVELDQSLAEAWQLKGLTNVEDRSNGQYRLFFSAKSQDPRPEIFDYVVKEGRRILTMQEMQKSMEDIFQKLTRN